MHLCLSSHQCTCMYHFHLCNNCMFRSAFSIFSLPRFCPRKIRASACLQDNYSSYIPAGVWCPGAVFSAAAERLPLDGQPYRMGAMHLKLMRMTHREWVGVMTRIPAALWDGGRKHRGKWASRAAESVWIIKRISSQFHLLCKDQSKASQLQPKFIFQPGALLALSVSSVILQL